MKDIQDLTFDEAAQELAFLAAEIAKADTAYYQNDDPYLSDADYDRLKHRNAATVYGRYAITDACSADDVMRLVSSSTYRLLLSARTAVLGVAKYLLGENYLKIRKKLLGTR